eukprot:scaffold22048_cov64-Phaeocystis_antarctica.AAC.4
MPEVCLAAEPPQPGLGDEEDARLGQQLSRLLRAQVGARHVAEQQGHDRTAPGGQRHPEGQLTVDAERGVRPGPLLAHSELEAVWEGLDRLASEAGQLEAVELLTVVPVEYADTHQLQPPEQQEEVAERAPEPVAGPVGAVDAAA